MNRKGSFGRVMPGQNGMKEHCRMSKISSIYRFNSGMRDERDEYHMTRGPSKILLGGNDRCRNLETFAATNLILGPFNHCQTG